MGSRAMGSWGHGSWLVVMGREVVVIGQCDRGHWFKRRKYKKGMDGRTDGQMDVVTSFFLELLIAAKKSNKKKSKTKLNF